MYFQVYQGEVGPKVGYEVPGEDHGAQMMQLTQVQLAHILVSAVSQAQTQQMQPIGNSSLAVTAAIYVPQNIATVQQVQSLIKFSVPIFKGYRYNKLIDVKTKS